MDNYRIEHDTMGDIRVPNERLWGAQTQRSLENFAIGTEKMPTEIIKSFSVLKSAAAKANFQLGILDKERETAITSAVSDVLSSKSPDMCTYKIWQASSEMRANGNINGFISHI